MCGNYGRIQIIPCPLVQRVELFKHVPALEGFFCEKKVCRKKGVDEMFGKHERHCPAVIHVPLSQTLHINSSLEKINLFLVRDAGKTLLTLIDVR